MCAFDLISDISTLTTLPEKTLRKLGDKGIECICHNVLESLEEDSMETSIDIGVGVVKIIIDEDEIAYRFIPSTKLEDKLISTVTTKSDPLVEKIEDGLTARILNTYKDLI